MSLLTLSRNRTKTRVISVESFESPPPHWVLAIPGVPLLVDRLGKVECRRRLFHMSPSLIPIGLPWIAHPDIWGPILNGMVLFLAVSGFVLAIVLTPWLTRPDERCWIGAVLGYIAPILFALWIFPGRAELGLMTLQIVALGDGSATLGGKFFGGRSLPWNSNKRYSGLFCFIVIGSLAAAYSYWGERHPSIPFATAYLICFVAAICAGIVESLPIRSNDNLRVGTTALLAGAVMTFWIL